MPSANTSSPLVALSNDLAAAVERATPSIVAVNGRPRTPSTGVVWRQGLVVTTDHTLRQDEDISVTTSDGNQLTATVVGRDPATDLALLRVEQLQIQEPTLAGTEAVRIGHIVLALGRGVTASLGVISAVGGPWRTWRGGLIDQFVRPDVAIYTGFSGGPLVNAEGAIVGINTSGLSRGGALTIPVATVNRVVNDLATRGHVARGYLGIGMQPVRLPDTARKIFGTTSETALIVLSIENGGPAEKGGVLLGDVLVSIDGAPLTDTDDLQATLSHDRIGKPAKLQVLRGGSSVELTVVIGERP